MYSVLNLRMNHLQFLFVPDSCPFVAYNGDETYVSRSRKMGTGIFVRGRGTDNASRHFPSIRRRSSSWNKYVNRNFSFLSLPRRRPRDNLDLSSPSSFFFSARVPGKNVERRYCVPLPAISGPGLSPLNNSTCTLLPICKRGSDGASIRLCTKVYYQVLNRLLERRIVSTIDIVDYRRS